MTVDLTPCSLQLLFYEAERAWAYSQELNLQATQAPTNPKATATKGHDNDPASLRRRATSRLRRAVHWSTQLLSHCQTLYSSGRLSADDYVQATVYTLIINGRLFRHRYEFEDALVQLSVARGLLDELAGRAATSRDQALATAFADEIGPEIRHCAHEMRLQNSYDVDAIVANVAPKHRSQLVEDYDKVLASVGKEAESAGHGRQKLETLIWEDEPVPVRNPELVDVLLRVQEAEKRLSEGSKLEEQQTKQGAEAGKKGKLGKGARSKRGVAAYDAILLALSDAEEVARKLVEAQQLAGSTSSAAPAGTRDVAFVHAFVVYQLLSYRIQRDLLLISTLLHQSQAVRTPRAGGSAPKPRKERVDARLYPAIVKLLDNTIQSLGQMRALTIVDESPDLASAVEARQEITKARRCRYLARCYAPLKKYGEALMLTQHASIHLRSARSTLSVLAESESDPITFYPLLPADVDQLDKDVSEDSTEYKRDWFAYNGGSIDEEARKTYKKPLFFDIALNYATLDMDRLQERAGNVVKKTPQQAAVAAPTAEKKPTARVVEEVERALTPEPSTAAKGGFGGLLGGWWGRK